MGRQVGLSRARAGVGGAAKSRFHGAPIPLQSGSLADCNAARSSPVPAATTMAAARLQSVSDFDRSTRRDNVENERESLRAS